MLKEQHAARRQHARWCPTATCAPATSAASSARHNNPEWKTVAFDTTRQGRCCPTARSASAGGRTAAPTQGKWNLESKDARNGQEVKLKLSVLEGRTTRSRIRDRRGGLPVLRRRRDPATSRPTPQGGDVQRAKRAGRAPRALGKDGEERYALVATVFDLQVGQLRRRPRPAGELAPRTSTTTRPTPRPGRRPSPACRASRSSPWRASSPTTPTRRTASSMVIIGAAMNHWYHCGHELPRRHQHADDVRLHRPERRRLGALRRARKSCARKPAGRRWPSRSTGFARRAR